VARRLGKGKSAAAQPVDEIAASSRKPMPIKLLAVAFAYFSESGLFSGLRPIQIIIFALLSPAAGHLARRGVRSGEQNKV
jgi:hypothetical protein